MRREDVDFMLGDGLLAACVVEKGAKERRVRLPAGETFYSLFERMPYRGGETVTLPAPLEDTPLLQRGGSILPLKEEDGIHLWICPDRNCSFALYEDDGISARGDSLETTVTARWEGRCLRITSDARGSYRPEEALAYHIQCPGMAPVSITWGGEVLPQFLDEERLRDRGWHYSHATKSCIVRRDTGREPGEILVSFEKFDLIRMEDSE